jgi:hypothetical protein
MLAFAMEYPGYCATAPLSSDSTSNRTTAPAATVSGDGASIRARLPLGFLPFSYGSRTWYQAARSSVSTVSPRNTVEKPLPAIIGGLSHHGTP